MKNLIKNFKLIVVLIFTISATVVFSQASECSTSGENATIIFGQGIVPKLNNNPIPNGSIIRAMYQTPSGLKCAGFMEWNGQPNSIAAFGAEGTNEGFKQQEVFKYSIKLPDGTEITNDKITVNYKSPDGLVCVNTDKYTTNGISCIESFTATTITNCSGTPNAGTVSGEKDVCPNTNFTLTVSGYTTGQQGLSGQWQSSSNGTSWSNISGQISTSLTIKITSDTYFRYTLKCEFGSTGNSSAFLVKIKDCGSTSQPFTTVWKIPSGNSTLSFFIQTAGPTTYNWTAGSKSGNGTWNTSNNGFVTINVSATSDNTSLTLSISPDNLRRFYMYDDNQNNLISSTKLLINVTNWGTVKWINMENMFKGCENLIINNSPTPPNLSNVNSMSSIFEHCFSLNGPENINSWDVSNVTNMRYLFREAYSFNKPIGNWNVSNVRDMRGMLASASSFNQPIGNWNTSNVTVMEGLFNAASSFNQPIGNWNTSNVAEMNGMFAGTSSFNQPIGNWKVSNVTKMQYMFSGASSFNQSIGNWDVSKVTDMSVMFYKASSFNKPIANWKVSNVTKMQYMFADASSFNQPIGNWDVSKVIDMSYMFIYAPSFNQPIDNWNVSKVINMSYMFAGASSFNQPIGNWKLNSNITLTIDNVGLFYDSGMDCNNYSATLIGWQQNNPNVRDRVLGAYGLKYGTNAVSARNALINRGWNIYGDKPSGTLCGSTATEDTYQPKTTVYPNPGYDIIYVDGLYGSNSYTLYNLTGQVIKTGIIDADDHEVSISHLNAGIYILKVDTYHGAVYHKVIKEE